MAAAARDLALHLVLVALAFPAAARPEEAGAEALAALLLRASEAQRQRLLGDAEFASVGVAKALLDLGEKATLDAEFPRAVVAFRTAEAVARRAKADKEIALALNGAAKPLYRQGELEPARKMAEEALRAHGRLGDPAGQAEAWNTIGNVSHARAEYQDSLAAGRKRSSTAPEVWP